MYKNLSMDALGHPVPFEETCALAQKHNFSGVELDLRFLHSLGSTQAAIDWFSATGLKPGGFALNAAWRESDSDEAFEKSLDSVVADADLAAAVDCRRCFTWVMPRSEKLDFYQHFDLVVPRLITIAEILAKHGTMLGFEFLGPRTMRTSQHKDFVHTLDGMRTFAAAIGMHSLNTGVVLDSFHWYTSGGSIQEIEHLDHREVVDVHLSDGVIGRAVEQQLDQEREMVGSTDVIDIAGFLSALRTIGYVGPLTVEPFNALIKSMSPDGAAAAASAALDRVLAEDRRQV
jgi:sugar phosphate isomerase/epimerase